MHQHHFTRRIVLSAAVVGLAILTALGGGDAVNAETSKANDVYTSKADFKQVCESNPGATFIDVPNDNLTVCAYSDGGKTSCDQKGKNCYWHEPPKREETGTDPFLGSNGEIITEPPPMETAPTVEETLIGGGVVGEDVQIYPNETQTVVPVDAPLEASAETEIAAPVESQGAAAAEAEVVAAPVEEPVALSEEPVTIEASAEQP